MDFNATIDLIIRELREAGEIIDDLKKYPGVPQLQVELAKLKCRSAAEVIAILKNMGDEKKEVPGGPQAVKNEEKQQIVQKAETPVTDTLPAGKQEKPLSSGPVKPPSPVLDRITAQVNQEAAARQSEKIIVREVEMTSPPPVEITTGIAQEEKPRVAKEKKTDVTEQAAGRKSPEAVRQADQSRIIADQFSPVTSAYDEQLINFRNEADLAEALKSKPITSLKDAIGLNDRFLFIREIFHGSHDEYTQAIDKLEISMSVPDARAIIMSYTGDNDENEAVSQLLDLVKRKLPADE